MALVGAQIAVALTLLASAGLLVKALHELSRVDPGFRPEGVYASHIILGGHYRRDLEARRVYFKQLVENVRALPGVSDAALSTTPPIPGLGEAPIGRELELFLYGETRELEVIGGSADTRFDGLDQPPRPALFLAHPQMPFLGIAVVARTSLGPRHLWRNTPAYGAGTRSLAAGSPRRVPRGGALRNARDGALLLDLARPVCRGRANARCFGHLRCLRLLGPPAPARDGASYRSRRQPVGSAPPRFVARRRGDGPVSRGGSRHRPRSLESALQHISRGRHRRPPSVLAAAAVALAGVAMAACIVPARQAAKVQPRWLSAPNSACDDCFHRTLESPHRILVLCRLLDDGLFGIDAVFPSSKAASCALLFDADNDLDFDLALIDEIADEVLIMIHRGAASETAHRPVQ